MKNHGLQTRLVQKVHLLHKNKNFNWRTCFLSAAVFFRLTIIFVTTFSAVIKGICIIAFCLKVLNTYLYNFLCEDLFYCIDFVH